MRSELDTTLEAWRRRWSEELSARQRLAEQAHSRVALLADHLRRRGAARVFLFGSLASGGFHRSSDIDLAAEGLPPGAVLYRIAAELDDLAAPFRVDLVPLEDAPEEVRRKVSSTGVPV